MPPSSDVFERAFILELAPSRRLAVWWTLVHALLGAALLGLDLPALAALPGIGLVAAHGFCRRPRAPRRLMLAADGTWAIPETGEAGLKLAPGTAWSTWWAELVLRGAGVRRRILILSDQLDPEAWRRLQVGLREHHRPGL